jgi:hypothetical protein
VIFDNDPRLTGSIAFNEFRNEVVQMKQLPSMHGNVKREGNDWSDLAEVKIKA